MPGQKEKQKDRQKDKQNNKDPILKDTSGYDQKSNKFYEHQFWILPILSEKNKTNEIETIKNVGDKF